MASGREKQREQTYDCGWQKRVAGVRDHWRCLFEFIFTSFRTGLMA